MRIKLFVAVLLVAISDVTVLASADYVPPGNFCTSVDQVQYWLKSPDLAGGYNDQIYKRQVADLMPELQELCRELPSASDFESGSVSEWMIRADRAAVSLQDNAISMSIMFVRQKDIPKRHIVSLALMARARDLQLRLNALRKLAYR